MAKFKVKDGVAIIPEGTTKIEREAFCDCPELTSVTIPNSVTSIGNYAFWGCSGLTWKGLLLLPHNTSQKQYIVFISMENFTGYYPARSLGVTHLLKKV